MSSLDSVFGRGGARRLIPWEQWDTSSLDAPGRARVGGVWRERRRQEHLAVGAFALLAAELAADGCEPVVLALAARAASDEVRHAEQAQQRGGIELPFPIPVLMQLSSKLMKSVAYRV